MAGVLAGALLLCGAAVAVGVVIINRSDALADPDPTAAPIADTGPIEWLFMERGNPDHDRLWGTLASEFTASGGADIQLDMLGTEEYRAMLATRTAQGQQPDLFLSNGGDQLREQVERGLVKDLTDDLADVIATMPPAVLEPYTVDGRVYGLPYHTTVIGLWYNRALFSGAGLDPDRPPQTWDDFLAAVEALRQDGTTPVAIGGVESWMAAFWYGCLATRVAGPAAFDAAREQRSLSANPDYLRAAELLADFAGLEPFQAGFEGATYAGPDGPVELISDGQAAMELMGSWAPGVYESIGSANLGDDLGWFPFPAVEGGNGAAGDLYGGGDGLAVGIDAPASTADFLRFLFASDNYGRLLESDPSLVSVRSDAEASDPHLAAQLAAIQGAPAMQPYLDTELPPETSAALLESMRQLLLGTTSPQEAVDNITQSWQVED